jgi:iron complex outermembrane receptor protein
MKPLIKTATISLTLFLFLSAAVGLPILAQATKTAGKTAVAAAGKISGKVTFGNDGTALPGTTVRIAELKLSTQTDADGNYTLDNLPPGRYSVVTHLEGFSDQARSVTVTAGTPAAPNTVDFELLISGVKTEVTISATGTEQTAFGAIESVGTIDSSKILERSTSSIGEALDTEPGVAKRSSGPGNSRPVIRGFDGDRVKVTTDGISVGSLASQSGDHAEPIDVMSVERIEVVKGPATLLYGSSAIGGVVNAISGHDEGAHPGLRGYFTTAGGANNAQGSAGGGIEYGRKNWTVWANGSGQRTGDYTAGGDFGKVLNTFTRGASGMIGGGYYGKKAFLSGDYDFYQSRYGIPLDITDPDPEPHTLRIWKNNFRINTGFTDMDSFITDAKFTLDHTNYRHQELEDAVVGTTFHNLVYSYRGVFDQRKTGRLTGRFGFEGFHRDFSTVGDEILIDGPVKENSFAAFGLEELNFERVTVQLGARLENNRYNPDNPDLTDRNFSGVSAAAGIRVSTWKDGAFVANYSHSERTPAMDELYNNGPHDGTLAFEVGNPALKMEKNDGLDLSVRHQNKWLHAEANFYYYNIGNFVFLTPTGATDPGSGFEIADYLQGDSRFLGTELSTDIKMHKYLNLLAGYDYVNAKLKTGDHLPRIAPGRGRIGVDFHYKGASIRPEYLIVATQDMVFEGETPTDGYKLFNLAASYVFLKKHYAQIFSFNAFNMGDEFYLNHISFIKDISPEIGRGMKFGYTLRFF